MWSAHAEMDAFWLLASWIGWKTGTWSSCKLQRMIQHFSCRQRCCGCLDHKQDCDDHCLSSQGYFYQAGALNLYCWLPCSTFITTNDSARKTLFNPTSGEISTSTPLLAGWVCQGWSQVPRLEHRGVKQLSTINSKVTYSVSWLIIRLIMMMDNSGLIWINN